VYLPEAAGPSSAPEHPQESVRHGSGRVLLIDDEEALVDVAGDLIERLGYQVTRFVRALDALDAVRADPGRFDVVVTDQNMPEMGGLELTRAIAALRSDLPVVLISGNRLSTDDELAAANIQYRLDKPFTGASLGRVLAQALNRS
jgi:CheY-like chemotaxis protein